MNQRKRVMAGILAGLLCLSLTACRQETASSADSAATTTGSATSGTATEGSGQTTGESTVPTDRTTEGSDRTTETPTTASSAAPTDPKAHTLTLQLEQWHPGVVDRDAEYTVTAELDGVLCGFRSMSYRSDAEGVAFDGNRIVIPYSVRKKGQPVRITGTETATGAEAVLEIPCKSWELTFSDEFNGSAIDTTKWGGHEVGSYNELTVNKMNAEVSDGVCRLYVRQEDTVVNANGKTVHYSQAGISTYGKYTQMYGLFTCSMKIPKESSLNSAFWMFPGGAYGSTYHFYDRVTPSKGCGEIDIVETSGAWGSKYCITEHFFDTANGRDHSSRHTYPELAVDPTEHFVEYSCAWLEDGLYYYADGKLVFTDTQVTVLGGSNGKKTGRPGRIIVTLGLYGKDNTWCGPWEFDESNWPNPCLTVDYVRAYQ